MLVTLYMLLIIVAVILFVMGVVYESSTFLGPAAAIFIIIGWYSFNLTFITSSGDVVKLSGAEWALAFLWWSFALISILYSMYDLLPRRGAA